MNSRDFKGLLELLDVAPEEFGFVNSDPKVMTYVPTKIELTRSSLMRPLVDRFTFVQRLRLRRRFRKVASLQVGLFHRILEKKRKKGVCV